MEIVGTCNNPGMQQGWKSFSALVLVIVSLGGAGVMASESAEGPQFLEDTASLMVRCSVLPVGYSSQGRRISGNLRSVCSDLQAFGNSARFVLNGVLYFAALHESRYSDGGDLNDLVITRFDGVEIARKESILSYGDVLLALALPRDDFREEFEVSLISE